MQNSRCILLGCVAALALLPFAARADDTDAQAKARQALEKQISSPPPQPPAKAPVPAAAQPAKPAPAPAVKPATPTPAPQPVAAASTNSLESTLHQTISDLNTQPASASSGPWAVEMPAPVDSEEMAKAREALRQKISDLGTQPEVPPASMSPHDAAVYMAVKHAQEDQHRAELVRKTVAPSEPPPMDDLSGPVLPIPAVKQQRLDALLQQYENDQISPEQYHEQRAKILAGQ